MGAIPETRLLTPDDQVWTDAGLVAGTLARAQGFQPHQRKELLNDALILLTAAKAGLAVLTSDRDHYDLLQQLCPEGHFVTKTPPAQLRPTSRRSQLAPM